MFGGPGFAFNMGGGPGIRVHQFGGNRPRRRPHNHEQEQQPAWFSTLSNLLPLLLLFILPLLSSLFSGTTPTGPTVRTDAAVPPHTMEHISRGLKIPYWVNPTEVRDYSAKQWAKLDTAAEGKLTSQLMAECEWEQNRRQRLAQEAQGFFFTDQVKMQEARQMEMPSCRRLQGYGYRF